MIKILSFIRYSLPDMVAHPSWAHKPFQPLFRFLYLKLYLLLRPSGLVFNWLGVIKLVLRSGSHGLSGNYYFGLHEYYEMAFCLYYLRQGDIFVDVGSNLGSYSLLAAGFRRVNVIAFEPVLSTYKNLLENIQLNDLQNLVDTRNICLTSRSNASLQFISMTTNRDCANKVVNTIDALNITSVPCATLDQQITGCHSISLMKLDVEGHEVDVLDGARLVFKNSPPCAIIIEDKSETIQSFLHLHDYERFIFCPVTRILTIYSITKDLPTMKNSLWINRVCLEHVQARLLRSNTFNFFPPFD